jgi:N-acyl-D-aspartate/D-glutamate deacylase
MIHIKKRLHNPLVASLLALASMTAVHAQESARASTLIINAQIADGTGAPLQSANVRIAGNRIVKVGELAAAPGERVIDAKGLVLAPGFIDLHNHSEEGLKTDSIAATQIAQGITTALQGADGYSVWPIGEWLDERRRNPASLNLATAIGHATIRERILQQDYKRPARRTEITEMVKLVEQAMREGAVGLSSGLEYDVASYSATDEVVAMAAAAAKHGGFYMTHVRDEADRSFEALREELAIGERAPVAVQHSHIKLGTVNVWGKASEYVGLINEARGRGLDFLADCYPYDAWYSTIKVLVPDKQYRNPTSVERALADVGGAGNVTISRFPPNTKYESRTLEQIAREAGISPIDMFIKVIGEGETGGADAGVIVKSMTDDDMKVFYQQPWVMVSSDGGIDSPHPRGAGSFPRVLGPFVRDKRWLTLPEAVRKMTSLPAKRLGLTDRGTIREGAFADLVLFDAKTVRDRSTFASPYTPPLGIDTVFVNGVVVWNDGKATGARPGRVLVPTLDRMSAARFAQLALDCVHKEYPNKIAHVLQSEADAKAPRQLTPAFFGCYDWHSSVHGHWLLARVAKLFPDSDTAKSARAALARSLTPENIAAEVAYLTGPGRESFERPYGLAWLLQLAAELRVFDDPQGREWATVITPLEAAAVRRITTWLPKLAYPIRVGEHDQTAFAFGLIWDWAGIAHNSAMESLLREKASQFYSADRTCPLAYEPSGQDFLSPCIAEADFMRRVLEPQKFAAWLGEFLPQVPQDGSTAWLPVARITDRSDPKLAHLDGLNLSRAWMLEGIASGLPGTDARRRSLQATAKLHTDASLGAVTSEHYVGSHWLGTFALYGASASSAQ